MSQAMVYGSHNSRSGTGIAYGRNPETGEKALYGEYLWRGGGEDIVAGSHIPQSLEVAFLFSSLWDLSPWLRN
jgi:pyruvate, orthophosphate dikinase